MATAVCAEPGCPNFRPCPIHPEPDRRSPSSRATGRRDWRKTRARILARDRHRCQLKLPGCTTLATQVDHVIPVTAGGTDADGNLRAACATCNNRKGGR